MEIKNCNVFSIGACSFTGVNCWMFFVVESAENQMSITSVGGLVAYHIIYPQVEITCF